MTKAYSKLTAKAQTTVPKPVREALHLKPGDAIAYEIRGNLVTLRRESGADTGYLKAIQGTLSEWETPEDAAAYDDL
jgi:antitoxin PrlF